MKRIIFVTVLSAMSACLFAQINFGMQLGTNIANIKSKYSEPGFPSESNDGKSKIGILGGVVVDIPFSTSLSFRPEINFLQKGVKDSETQVGITYTSTSTLNYLELPLNIVYKINAGSGKVFFGIGPSVAFGISGKYKYTQTGSPDQTIDIKFDGKKNAADGKGHLKAFDFGGNFNVGYQLSMGLFINMGYTLGFANIHPEDYFTTKNSGFAIKIGYMFGSNKGGDK